MPKGFLITGRAAHERIARLFLKLTNQHDDEWVDLSPYAEPTSHDIAAVKFLWENSPRHTTRSIRDKVTVYSHLPNGTNVLDDKWVLARLLGSDFVTRAAADDNNSDKDGTMPTNSELSALESHCFRGVDFVTFAERVGLFSKGSDLHPDVPAQKYQLEDLMQHANEANIVPPPPPQNLWVIKDAMSNGAGGIWILDSSNIDEFLDPSDDDSSDNESVLHPTHRYIAQRYVWPPTLYYGRKCHVRVYGCITSKGEGYVHKRSFLHVANDTFQYSHGDKFEPSVHITNCCANSHDVGKFAGEICANLLEMETKDEDIGLGQYFPSIAASVAELARKSAPFLRGGRANHGFEYLGMDFVLSSRLDAHSSKRIPVAYLLEVNAPPSQDTATGLPHAEALHDEVLSDLLRMCVLPELGVADRECGGWKCVYSPDESSDAQYPVVPSKAAFVNRVKWNMFEKKAIKEYEIHWSKIHRQRSECESLGDFSLDLDAFVRIVRTQFPYFSLCRDVFLESGGGSQVPKVVMDSMLASMMHRDRSVAGAKCLKDARGALLSLLTGHERNNFGDNTNANMLFMGPNATSLLDSLAHRCFSSTLKEGDEIILASENHLANVLPWIYLANKVGAMVKWWTLTDSKKDSPSKSTPNVMESTVLSDLVTQRTKIVAISHASNILGCVRDIPSVCQLVHQKTANQGQVVVDGVAAAPHMLSSDIFVDASLQPDWYVVSLHKMFGPHVGCLIGKNASVHKLHPGESDVIYKQLEMGTMNYEACAGACALKEYFQVIGTESIKLADIESSDLCLVQSAKVAIHIAETRLLNYLLCALSQSSSSIRVIQDPGHQRIGFNANSQHTDRLSRLPFVSFIHSNIKSTKIVEHCRSHGVICRACRFLSTERFWSEIGIGDTDVVRFSLSHYNSVDDIERTIRELEMMDGWA
jgi:selenocysteine lyase/cysteine desulfurase